MPSQIEKVIFALLLGIIIGCIILLIVHAVKNFIVMCYDRWERMQMNYGGFMVSTDCFGRQRRKAKFSTCWDAHGNEVKRYWD